MELSEAINSMFRWYQDAEVCYAYLSDVVESPTDLIKEIGFRKSKWFTRGWTLQELLAPDELVFLDRLRQEIGSKESLQELLRICHEDPALIPLRRSKHSSENVLGF